jgi:transposase
VQLPPSGKRASAHGSRRLRAAVVRRIPPRRVASFDDGSVRFRSYPGYPDGYDLDTIGAPQPTADLDASRRARDVRSSG